jgi:hypothetical protein
MERKEALRRACLSATLAVAWAGSSSPAKAQTPGDAVDAVYIRTSFYHSLTNAHFVGFNGLTWLFTQEIGAIPAGEAFTTVTLGTGSGTGGGPFDKYAIVGITGITSLTYINGLAMGFTDPNAALGRDFETVFPGFSEPQVRDALITSSPLMDSFFSKLASMPLANLGINEPVPYATLHFSQGVPFGTMQASFTPIPEPVSGMVCLGALGFGLISRRRVEA